MLDLSATKQCTEEGKLDGKKCIEAGQPDTNGRATLKASCQPVYKSGQAASSLNTVKGQPTSKLL